jgi:hypothetical protein
MTTKAAFSTEEWNLLRILPALVSSGVSAADPGGIIGAVKEAAAGAKGLIESLQQGSGHELLAAMLEDRSTPGTPDPKTLLGEGDRRQQMENLKSAVLARIEEAMGLLGRKAAPGEAAAYRHLILGVAEKAASAAKEGGFLGFGGERVSGAEQAFLDDVKNALGLA